ncbi:MAG: hypothetical protein JNJ88_05500 [Planctomycetes bacterium]|nr:hypothetical protein [Planctomycetota bacterium]
MRNSFWRFPPPFRDLIVEPRSTELLAAPHTALLELEIIELRIVRQQFFNNR